MIPPEIENFHNTYIKFSLLNDFVPDFFLKISKIRQNQTKLEGFVRKIYLSTRALKHLYDKRPAEEYDSILRFVITTLSAPDYIYKNKDSKRGDVCFVKEIQKNSYLVSVEECDGNPYFVTMFRVRKKSYLKNYSLLWSREDGEPPS